MSNLFASLRTSADTLSVLQEALGVSQNNVMNASAPGYARQRLNLRSLQYNPDQGMVGGVAAGSLQSAREEYGEESVRSQVGLLGQTSELAMQLTRLENSFPIGEQSGLAASMGKLFQSFSAWSVGPNGMAERQNVLLAADGVAAGFQHLAAELSQTTRDSDRQLQDVVNHINSLAGDIRTYNEARRRGTEDPGLDAQVHAKLEELSELVNFTALHQQDGTITVLIGGQSPLVSGVQLNPVSLRFEHLSPVTPEFDGATPSAVIAAADGRSLNGLIERGKLAGGLEFRNEVLPSLQGDSAHAGEINRLAEQIANRINQILTSNWPPPQVGVPLYAMGASRVSLAHTLSVNPGVAPLLLAAIEPATPSFGQAASKLAALANPTDSSDKIDGTSFTGFYARITAGVGQKLATAQDGEETQQQLVAQARKMRADVSGVSLDEEAAKLMELQKVYQANARMVSVIDEMMDTLLGLLR